MVYGDLSISPLYVYKSIFEGKLQSHQHPDAILGAFSLIFWTLTLMPLLKYVFVVLSADDNGEGMPGLYSNLSVLVELTIYPFMFNQMFIHTVRWAICSIFSTL